MILDIILNVKHKRHITVIEIIVDFQNANISICEHVLGFWPINDTTGEES